MADQRNPNQSVTSSSGQQSSGQQNVSGSGGSRGLSQQRRQGYDPFVISPDEFFANPFSVMRRMQNEMDRAFADALGGGMASGSHSAQSGGGGMLGWSPAVEISQRGQDLLIHADLPGLKPEEVHVELSNDSLILQGERRQEQQHNEGRVHRTERQYGRFYREIQLPEGINPEQVKARFDHGVLEITVPMPQQQSNRRQIPIQGGSAASGSSASGSSSSGSSSSGSSASGSSSAGSSSSGSSASGSSSHQSQTASTHQTEAKK